MAPRGDLCGKMIEYRLTQRSSSKSSSDVDANSFGRPASGQGSREFGLDLPYSGYGGKSEKEVSR